ncbi:DUF2103 domain-containing protein [Candidatus Absconditicoccus praedator]|uniref:DUF2103 domain-containing protein n=1 Tax=Candidatus Absconditicoccus praedator TaxID=2735562 RepID=UPI001E481753|nr:DUF2103 domain-containing protein [Candidatus Absconditicoccus praedator]UFX82958.1 metal-binding protein [Candidatus Absconditicoccus praedator]
MKYNTGKIKTEHNILPEFIKTLEKIQKIDEIKRIIPGRIYRKQKGSSHKILSFSYYTDSGIKYIAKKGGTAQEIFIICQNEQKENIYKKINNIISEK